MGRPDETSKKEALKLSQIAPLDDILTDALVDRVYFWTTIRKNRARYSASRGIREEDVTKILQQSVIIEKDSVKACKELLELPGLKRYYEKLPTNEEKEHFNRHLRKYVNIYLPDCPFEVATTNRYTIDTQEAAAIARREIKKGDEIKYLCGIQIPLTRDEEQDLGLTRRDFSIVVSSRKRTSTLFMGPARFANHDCDANARLTARGSHGMAVIAVKDIKIDEEITVSYGDDYFGINNCECLCGTCERLERNGWNAPKDDETESRGTPEIAPLDDLDEVRYRYRTRHASRTRTSYQSPASTPDHPGTPSRKRKQDRAQMSQSPSIAPKHRRVEDLSVPTPEKVRSKLRQVLQSADANMQSNQHSISARLTPPASSSTASTNIFLPHLNQNPAKSLIGNFGVQHAGFGEMSNFQLMVSIRDESEFPNIDNFRVDIIQCKSPPPSSQPVLVFDNDVVDNSVSQPERGAEREPEAETELEPEPEIIEGESEAEPERAASISSKLEDAKNYRRPKDYTLTRLLLSTPFSRWVRCHVCNADFVQEDAYRTRWSCPRCERHSKLYGYQWPKTEKAGKNDKEERVLDHRVINRFVFVDEEKTIKKGRIASLQDLQTQVLSGRASPSVSDYATASQRATSLNKRKSGDERATEEIAIKKITNAASGSAAAKTPEYISLRSATPAESLEAGDEEDSPRRNPGRAKRRTRAYRNSESPPSRKPAAAKSESVVTSSIKPQAVQDTIDVPSDADGDANATRELRPRASISAPTSIAEKKTLGYSGL